MLGGGGLKMGPLGVHIQELKTHGRDPETQPDSSRRSSLVCSLDAGPVETLWLQLPYLLKTVLAQP